MDVAQNPDGSIQLDKDGKVITMPAAVREYSDTLLIFLLKGMRPQKYRDQARVEHTAPDGGGITGFPLGHSRQEDGAGRHFH
jgi:hypothetical protein